MKHRLFVLVLLSLQWIFSPTLFAQDYSRFNNVKKWKITYKIEDYGYYDYPTDFLAGVEISSHEAISGISDMKTEDLKKFWDTYLLIQDFLRGLSQLGGLGEDENGNLEYSDGEYFKYNTYSRTVVASYMEGTLLFDKKDPWEPLAWSGAGKIDCKIYNKTVGLHLGSYSEGTMEGEGTTKLYSDDSYFSIDPDSGTYELYLVPGDGDHAGINIKITSKSEIMEDMYNQIALQMGVSNENVKDFWSNIVTEKDNELSESQPEYIDLFYAGNGDQWTVELEYQKLPDKGMVISGLQQMDKFRYLNWTIEPAD
jgi:hypothetical protein